MSNIICPYDVCLPHLFVSNYLSVNYLFVIFIFLILFVFTIFICIFVGRILFIHTEVICDICCQISFVCTILLYNVFLCNILLLYDIWCTLDSDKWDRHLPVCDVIYCDCCFQNFTKKLLSSYMIKEAAVYLGILMTTYQTTRCHNSNGKNMVQIWPGLIYIVYTQIRPGRIWTTL